MAKIVIIEENGKNVVRNQSESTGKIEAYENMPYRYFANTYKRLSYREHKDGYLNLRLVQEYKELTQEDLMEMILEGEMAKRELLSRDWSDTREVEILEQAIKNQKDKLKRLKAKIHNFKAK